MPTPMIFRILTVLAVIIFSAGCVQGEFYRECEAGSQCPEGQICRFSNCVLPPKARTTDAGMDSDASCPDDASPSTEICDGLDNDCDGDVDAEDDDLNPEGCAAQPNATVTGCVDGACTWRCQDDYVDVDDDLGRGTNGCECHRSGEESCGG